MSNSDKAPCRVTFADGHGNLPKLEISTPWSDAELYLHGAHITHFQKKGEEPLLFLSQSSRFQEGVAIRGGIPVIFPWFGAREGYPMHGIARIRNWRVNEILNLPSGEVCVRLTLPSTAEPSLLSGLRVEYSVTVGAALVAELLVANETSSDPFAFENCLHSYFHVGDINSVIICGLQGAEFLDKVENFSRKTENNAAIEVSSEVDRVYLNTEATVEILDHSLGRKIVVEKCGSRSTVVWNPWSLRARQMSDLGDDDYLKMVCVESGNVSENRLSLAPGQTSELKVILGSEPL